jgi:hypothetical protein
MDYPQPWFDEVGGTGVGGTGAGGAPVYPLYHPLMAIATVEGAAVRPVRSNDEKRVLGLCYERAGEGQTLWLANLTAEPQPIRIAGAAGMTLKTLDA